MSADPHAKHLMEVMATGSIWMALMTAGVDIDAAVIVDENLQAGNQLHVTFTGTLQDAFPNGVTVTVTVNDQPRVDG